MCVLLTQIYQLLARLLPAAPGSGLHCVCYAPVGYDPKKSGDIALSVDIKPNLINAVVVSRANVLQFARTSVTRTCHRSWLETRGHGASCRSKKSL